MISIPGRIPIHIHPIFWVLIFMIGYLNAGKIGETLIWAAVIFVSVLIHEFGHALTAVAFGQSAEISLVGLGGVTKRQGPVDLSRWKDFLIVFNGPLAGLLLCLVSYSLLQYPLFQKNGILVYALEISTMVNLFWTLLNLLPVLPLDGGQLLRILLEGIFGFKGLKVSLFLSLFLAALFGLYFFAQQQILMGALFLMMGFENYRSWSDVRSLGPNDHEQPLQSQLREAIEDLRLGNRDEAYAKFVSLKDLTGSGKLNTTAIEYMARMRAEKGQFQEAYDLLEPLEQKLSEPYLNLLQQLAYKLEKWSQVVKVGAEAYRQSPSAESALLNALAYSIMGETKQAIGWLRCSIQSGLPNITEVINKREFDAIRHTPEFEKLERNRR